MNGEGSGQGVDARITGPVSGQIAVGNKNIQVVAEHGAVVNLAVPEEQPVPRRRPGPVSLLPRDFRGLLGREPEVEAATVALGTGQSVQFFGQAGLGKTSLLRFLTNRTDAETWEGVVYHRGAGQPAGDLAEF